MELAHQLVSIQPGDQYIASYPRSGNTWLRTMLVNVMVPEANSNPDVFNRLLPGVSLRNLPKIGRLSRPRIIKSHSRYRPAMRRAVYIVRDGRDVLISYYHYLITRNGLADRVSFSEFFDGYCHGRYGQLWHENVVSWLRTGREALGDQLMVIRFEEMRADPDSTLRRIVDFLDLHADSGQITEAIEKAKLENVRQIEMLRRKTIPDPNMSFYRGGKTDQGQRVFTSAQWQRFSDLSADALELAGYPTSR